MKKIVSESGIHGGAPCFEGTRIPVYMALEILAQFGTIKDVVIQYPKLDSEDVKAALNYCAKLVGRE
jgi:uncharacterized protein (DUF433 family)